MILHLIIFQVVVSLRILVHSRFWNIFLVGGVFASLLFFLCFTLTYHGATIAPSVANIFYDQAIKNPPESTMPMNTDLYWVLFYLLKSPAIWLTTILALVLCLIPYLVAQAFINCSPCLTFFEKRQKLNLSSPKVEFDNYGYDDTGSIVNIRL